VTAACLGDRVATVTLDLPLQVRHWFCELAAQLTWEANELVVVAGRDGEGRAVLCGECCSRRPRTIVVVPDVEVVSRWGSAPKGAMRMERADGRTAYVFQGAS
jgi:hypothetical protein